MKREICIHKELLHQNIIRLYNFFENNKYFYLVLEYLPNGNLYEFMRGKSLDEGTILKLFRQMISAIDFVHSRKVFHRDIKPENILLDPQCNSKLCDFGFSAIFGDGQNRQTLCGTKDYLAPEVIMSHNQNDKVDIWCMGVLLYELIHKRPPFIGKNIIVLLEDIKSAKIKYLPNINPEFKRIIEWCLKLDPNARPQSVFALQKIIRDLPGGTGKLTFLGNLRKALFTPIKVR